jgi:hypothetical protein
MEAGRAEGAVRDALQVEVLTLGPLPPPRHALIKFLGLGGRELGQGVVCVGWPPQAEGSGRRQTVELSVGGDYRGSVSFDLDMKVRRRVVKATEV